MTPLSFKKEPIGYAPTSLQRKSSNSTLSMLLTSPSPVPTTPPHLDTSLPFGGRSISARALSYGNTAAGGGNGSDQVILDQNLTVYPVNGTVFIQQPTQLHTITVTLHSAHTLSQLLYAVLQRCCQHKTPLLDSRKQRRPSTGPLPPTLPPSPLSMNQIFTQYELVAADATGAIDEDCPSLDSTQYVDQLNIQYYRLVMKRANSGGSVGGSTHGSPYSRSSLNLRSNSDDLSQLTIHNTHVELGYSSNAGGQDSEYGTAGVPDQSSAAAHRLIQAVEAGNLKHIQQLIDHDATLHIGTVDTVSGHTPLIHAIANNQVHIANYCIRNEADVNVRSQKDGMTALHHACKLGLTDVADTLLNADADVEIKDDAGKRAVEYVDSKNTELLELLQSGQR